MLEDFSMDALAMLTSAGATGSETCTPAPSEGPLGAAGAGAGGATVVGVVADPAEVPAEPTEVVRSSRFFSAAESREKKKGRGLVSK